LPSQPGKLFVGGLSFATTEDGLLAYFSKFGVVKEAIVMRNPSSKRSRGFGFVTYEKAATATKCVEFSGHHVVDDQEVDVKHATPRADPASPTGTAGKRKSKVSARKAHHRPKSERSDAAMDSVNGGGGAARRRGWEVASVSVSSSATTGSPSARSAPYNNRDSNSGTFEGKSDDGNDADSFAGTNKIFVGGLHYNTRKSGLVQYFEAFGEIRTAQVLFAKDTGKSRGFGFITFTEPAAVDRVLQQRMHEVDGKVTEVKRATPKVDISSRKNQQWSKSGHNYRSGGGHDYAGRLLPTVGWHNDGNRGGSRGGGSRGRGGGRKGRPQNKRTHIADMDQYSREMMGGMGYPASYAAMAASGRAMPNSGAGRHVNGMTPNRLDTRMSSVALAPVMGPGGVAAVVPVAVNPAAMGTLMHSPVGPMLVVPPNAMQHESVDGDDTKEDSSEVAVEGSGTSGAVPAPTAYMPMESSMAAPHPGLVMALDPQTGLAVPVVSMPQVIPTPAGPMFVPTTLAASPHNTYRMAGAAGFSQFAWGESHGSSTPQFSMMSAGEGGGIMGHFNSGDGNLMGSHSSGAASARISEGLRRSDPSGADEQANKSEKKDNTKKENTP
jgi:RNA recognition motif-containing protein